MTSGRSPEREPTSSDGDDVAERTPHTEPPARDIVRDTRSDDDRDVGWGDDLDDADRGARDARWYEEQRPPHWE